MLVVIGGDPRCEGRVKCEKKRTRKDWGD
jgi:hypothetical protein